MRKYLVGGYVRDEILGVPSKDMDYSVVLDEQDRWIRDSAFYDDPFMVMVIHLESQGFTIFQEKREFLTVRAQFPKSAGKRVTADFVLARRESEYTDGRRPDKVIPGTLEDDLARRDFTMNAMAKTEGGNLIDLYNGRADIAGKVIRAVGDPMDRLTEDALRAVRALRFAVTKGMRIDVPLQIAMESGEVLTALKENIAVERIDEEMRKAFRFHTLDTLRMLEKYPRLRGVLFSGRLSLEPTLKQKGRNK